MIGWKEDFNLGFQDTVPGQWTACYYLSNMVLLPRALSGWAAIQGRQRPYFPPPALSRYHAANPCRIQ
ncbi:MAG: Mbeg1-like protein [Eisenbergiella sp.]